MYFISGQYITVNEIVDSMSISGPFYKYNVKSPKLSLNFLNLTFFFKYREKPSKHPYFYLNNNKPISNHLGSNFQSFPALVRRRIPIYSLRCYEHRCYGLFLA